MSQEQNHDVLDNESNLLQSTIDADQGVLTTRPPPSDNPHDDVPIGGGGKKFNFAEFPDEEQIIQEVKKPVRKPPARFANNTKKTENSKKDEEPEQKITQENEELLAESNVQSPDEIPIGGKKFEFSEFPEEGQEVKKPIRKPPARFADKMKKQENTEEKLETQPDKTEAPNSNDRPIGGNKTNFDEQPITAKNNNAFDDQPIGGGKKNEFSEYPEEGSTVAPPKKITKKATKAPIKKQESDPIVNNDDVPIGGGSKIGGEFDEVPIGKTATSSNFMMSEFPEGDEQPVVETNYTMSQKLKSKAVKLKLSGMEDLLELLTNDPNNNEISEIEIGKLLKETNPACLEKILQCLKVWVEKDKRWGDDETKNCIENGYINGKPNTKKLSVEVVDLMYEKSPDVVEMAILVGLKGKVPKNLAGYIAILNEMLTIYGIKRLKFLKPYFPDLVTILNREKLVAVKTEGMTILKEAYKWLSKEVVEPLTKDIKEGLKKELDTFWETYDKSQVMTAPKDIPEVNDGKPKKKVDAYELSEAFDVFKKFNEKWTEGVINEEKWSEKVRMMTEFYNAANVPKLANNSESRHVNEMIRRLINHSNFNVVLWDLKILAVLSKGLRKHFSPTVKAQFLNVIEKFREKRTQMVDETFNTLNEFNYCISIEDVIDDVKKGLGDKAPTMKVNLLNWIGKFVEKKVEEKDEVPDKAKDALKSLFPIFEKLLTDGVAEVRDSMIKNLGKMKILIGDDFFAPIDKKMSKDQAGKIDQIKRELPKKVSREKDKKETEPLNNTSTIKLTNKGSSKNLESNASQIQGKNDISDEIQDLIPKMNHSDWQKRKETAEAIISIISNNMDSKMNSGVLNDFLNSLKIRIADPNKNVIKYFVQLTVLTFETMSERDVKSNAKNFMCALAEGLSDKVEANKKEISLALNKLGSIYGRDQLLSILGGYLDNDRESRIEVMNIILENSEYIDKADTKEYPKGIIKGLTDKNKEIRNLAERLLEIVCEKVGIDIFKNLARNERPAIAKDLNTLLSKYEGGGGLKNNSSTLSKGVSPPKSKILPPVSGKKISQRSSSKNSRIHQESFDQEVESSENIPVNKEFYSTLPPGSMNILKPNKSFVEGNEIFAPLKILSTERVNRQEKDERYPWMCDTMIESQEEELRESIEALFKPELSKKMFSVDYRKVLEAGSQISKLSKDITHHNELREVYDLIFKWVFVRLWGGNPAIMNMIEVLPSVMSILEKKKLAIGDGEVDIIVAILRESFITGYMNENKVSDQLLLITKLLIALSSGDRLLKKLLRQFSVELPSIHRHIRNQATEVYRAGLRELIKKELMDYVGNGSSLEEASRIKELKSDSGFVELLYKRFHENVLDSFGFRNTINVVGSSASQHNNRLSPVPIRKVEEHQESKRQTIQTSALRTPTESVEGRTTLHREEKMRSTSKNQESQIKNTLPQQRSTQEYDDDFDLKVYPRPSMNNPLGKHLDQLQNVLVDDIIFSFFAAMFSENDRPSSELVTYANAIFGTILKSVKKAIENRNNIAPEKIVSQITLLQYAIKCKYIISNIDQQLLYHGTKFALYQLVYEDEYKNVITQNLNNRNIDFKPDQFVKVINGAMLRILENASSQETVNVLLNLLNKQLQMQQVSNKTVSLIAKCLSRVCTNYGLDINANRTKEFFIRANECLCILNAEISLADFNPAPDERLNPEKSVIKTLKQIIGELARIYNEEVWLHYETAISESRFQDNYISAYLQFLGVSYPENAGHLPQEDENLKRINDLLSKSKTFDAGIVELKKYMNANPTFNPIEHFTSRGYEQKFLVMVMNALESSRLRKTPTKREIREERSQNSRSAVNEAATSESTIQDKINKLKMRFDEIPSNKPEERSTVTVSASNGGKKEEDRGEERALEIKRRIDEMRNRLNRG